MLRIADFGPTIRRFVVGVLAAGGVLGGTDAIAQEPVGYRMKIVWSPEHCKRTDQDELQCVEEHYFVNHGLAIVYAGDEKPSGECKDWRMLTTDTDRWLWVIPNRAQIRRLWQKQGACSGMEREAYFAQVDRAGRRIELPQEFSGVDRPLKLTTGDLRRAFAAANAELPEDGMVLHCRAGYLSELEICFDADMQFQQCDAVDDCPRDIRLRPIRIDRQDRKPAYQ